MLKEARQDVAKNKTFYPSDKGRSDELQRAKIRGQIDEIAKSWGPHPAPVRLFAGKELNDSVVRLSDGQGRPRLVLKVDKDGSASIDFLDEAGKLIKRIM